MYAAVSWTSIAFPVNRLGALIPRTVPDVVDCAERVASVPVNVPVLEIRASDARLPAPENAPVPLTSRPTPPVPVAPAVDAPTSIFNALPVVRRPVVMVTALVPLLMPEPATSVTPEAVDVLPRSVTAPVVVSNVPFEALKLKFAVPPADVAPTPDAKVVAPLMTTAPVPVVIPAEPVCANPRFVRVSCVVVTFSTSAPATW